MSRVECKEMVMEMSREWDCTIREAVMDLADSFLEGRIDEALEQKINIMSDDELLELWADIYSH